MIHPGWRVRDQPARIGEVRLEFPQATLKVPHKQRYFGLGARRSSMIRSGQPIRVTVMCRISAAGGVSRLSSRSSRFVRFGPLMRGNLSTLQAG
jgi:hypothetical protein